MSSRLRVVLGVLFFVVCGLQAQQLTSISGYVTDPSGAAIPAARVTATNLGTGLARSVTTDAQGHYVFSAVSAGHYKLSATAKGFKTTVQPNLVVNLEQQVSANLSLQLGAATQTVSVHAAAVHLQVNSGTVGYTVTGSQIRKIAVNGRNFYELAQIVPGSANAPTASQGAPAIGHLSSSSVVINGLRSSSEEWEVDGAWDLDPGSNGSIDVSPPPDAISQFRVQTSNYSAAYGQAGGAVVNVRLKSGTNQFHGSAYEFVRNSALDAEDTFLKAKGQAKAPLKLNDFGFTVGGPLVHKKLFFFYSEEFRRLRTGNIYNTHTPSPLELAGNFSGPKTPLPKSGKLTLPPGVAASCQTGPTQFNPACFNPYALDLIKAGIFPTQTVPQTSSDFNNYITSSSVPTNYHQELVRVDYQINSRLHLMGHFIHEGYDEVTPTTQWAGSSFPTVQTNFAVPSKNLAVRLTQIVSPTLLNETDFQFTDDSDTGSPVGIYTRPAGFPTATLFGANTGNRIPAISLSNGYGSFNVGRWPYALNTPLYSAADNLTQTAGNQTFTYGAMWQYGIKNQPNEGNTEGAYSFNGTYTGNPLADFLFGYPVNYNEISGQIPFEWRYQTAEAYLEDDIKASRHLTLNLGVRYYLLPHAYDANNNFTTWEPNLYSGPVNHTGGFENFTCGSPYCSLNGIAYAGDTALGVPRSTAKGYFYNFAPRIGFAWQPTGWRHTVIRGGWGVTYYRVQLNDILANSPNNPPVITNETIDYSKSTTIPALGNPTAGTPKGASPSGLNALAYNYKLPMVQQYSLGIQHRFADNTILSVSYVGSDARHLSDAYNANQPYAFTCPSTGVTGVAKAPNCTAGVRYQFNPGFNYSTSSINNFRPYLGFAGITTYQTSGSSEYNSIQVHLDKHMTQNLLFQVSYTASRSLDNTSNYSFQPQNPYNRNADWAVSNWNRPQVLIVNYVYNLPFFRGQNGFLGETLGGWTWAGITSIESGTPFSVGVSGSTHGLAGRPDQVAGVLYPKTEAEWFTPTSFAQAPAGFYGNLGRNTLQGPGMEEWDMTFNKNFRIGERANASLQFGFFNIFNHVNLNNPNATVGSPNIGTITGDLAPRVVQMGIDISF